MEKSKVSKPVPVKKDNKALEEQKLADFINKYNTLCKESGFCVTGKPLFQLRDDGTYSLIVTSEPAKLKNNK